MCRRTGKRDESCDGWNGGRELSFIEEKGKNGMTFWEMLHQVILGPIDLLLDVVFSFGMQLSGNPALSIVVLSLAVNLLVLPLYLRADALQMEEKETAERL